MRASPFCGAAMLALMLAPAAMAQTSEGRSAGLPATAAPTSGSDPAALRALVGREVETAAGDSIGEVDDVVLMEGRRTFLVVSVGGFLGLGTKLVTVPYENVTMTSDGVMVNMTADQLKRQPAYDPQAQVGTSLKSAPRK